MSARAGLAAATLALACLRPAAAQERPYSPEEIEDARAFVEGNPDFGSAFTRAWEKALGELDSLREHRDFVVRRRRLRLVIADTGHGIRDQEAASYVLGSVYLNRTYLAIQAAQLCRLGMPPEEAAVALAWKMMPILAHEIRHGMNEEAMRAGLGLRCAGAVLEDEETTFYDNACVSREAIQRRPELWEDSMLLDIDAQSGIILSRWKEGPARLAELVRERYPGKIPILSAKRAELAAVLRKDSETLEKVLRETPRYRKVLKTSRDPVERERAQAYLDSPPSFEEAGEMLKYNLECRRALERPDTYAELREFYRGRLAAARRLCRP